MAKRFQFNLRGMLIATFWVSVGLSAFTLFAPVARYANLIDEAWPGHYMLISAVEGIIFGTLAVVVVVSPFLAAGSLFGKTGDGIYVFILIVSLIAMAAMLKAWLVSRMLI